MHVTAQSTNLESVPATNNQQQQSSALESHNRGGESGSNLNSGRSNKTRTSLSSSVDGKKQHGTTNLDDEVSFFPLKKLLFVLIASRVYYSIYLIIYMTKIR